MPLPIFFLDTRNSNCAHPQFTSAIDGKAIKRCEVNRDFEPPFGCGKNGELFEAKQ
jgi:hypothetical protein